MGRVGALAFGDDLPADVEVVDGSEHLERYHLCRRRS
jgi:hypothetical protein